MSTAVDDYNQPDTEILLNLKVCAVISIPMFLAYCFLRRRMFRVYDANLVNRNRYQLIMHYGCINFLVERTFLI